MKKNGLKDRLSRFRQIKPTVTGRNSGNAFTNPVWFVADDEKLYLLYLFGGGRVSLVTPRPKH
jgi:hypothetical protein